MKNVRKFDYFLIGISSILFLFIMFMYVKDISSRKNLSKFRKVLLEQQIKLKNNDELIKSLTKKFRLEHQAKGVKISELINIKDEDNKSVYLKDLISEHPKLIFRYSEIHCQICTYSGESEQCNPGKVNSF